MSQPISVLEVEEALQQSSLRNLSDEELDDENEAEEEEEWSTDLDEDETEQEPELVATVAEVKPPATPFQPKLLELLHADSPHYGTFWPLVFHWLDREDWARLASVSKFFNSMA